MVRQVLSAAALMMVVLSGAWGPVMAAEREVTFAGADGVSLAGTLNLPEGAGPFPALLLIQGSGPTDRNGNQAVLKTDLLRQLSDLLAEQGIASLRYDKRGMHANAAGMPTEPGALGPYFRWDAFVGDAAGALRFLAGREEIDPARVGIAGHSEGGVIALALARRAAAAADVAGDAAGDGVAPRLLVLLATPGRPLGDVVQEQLARNLTAQKAPPALAEQFLAEDRRIAAAIRETGAVPADVPQGLNALYPAYIGPFLQPLLGLDPAALAGGLEMPVLVVTGKADVQVSAERDAAAFARTLAGHSEGSRIVTPDGVGHDMKPVEGNGPGSEGPLAPAVAETLTAWLAERL